MYGCKTSIKGTHSHSNGKSTHKSSDKFYQPMVDAKKPKKSKLERIFGEEASRIRIESARISDKSRSSHSSSKSRGQTPPSQKGVNVTKKNTKSPSKGKKR